MRLKITNTKRANSSKITRLGLQGFLNLKSFMRFVHKGRNKIIFQTRKT